MTLKERLAQAEARIAQLEAQVAQLQQQMPQPVVLDPSLAASFTMTAPATTTPPIWASGSLICPQCGCYYNGVHYCVPNVTAGNYQTYKGF